MQQAAQPPTGITAADWARTPATVRAWILHKLTDLASAEQDTLPPTSVDGVVIGRQEQPVSPLSDVTHLAMKGSVQVDRLLFLDEYGNVWLGEEKLYKPLSGMLWRCFEYLWMHRRRVVSYDELIQVLYGPDTLLRADPPASLEKILHRLRTTLSPDKTSPITYIKTISQRGVCLVNYRDSREQDLRAADSCAPDHKGGCPHDR